MTEMASTTTSVATLVQICIKNVSQHMDVLEKHAWDLPASLLKDLVPHLNIFYLDRIETAAQQKGVSTSFVWAAIWKDVVKIWRCRSMTVFPDGDWKQKCLERLFHMTLFVHIRAGKKYLSNLSDLSVLNMTAKHVQVLCFLGPAASVCWLASEELRPILTTLEKGVRCLKLLDATSLLRRGRTHMLYILHRLVDHGSVRDVVLRRCPDPCLLTWIIPRCKTPGGAELFPHQPSNNFILSDLGKRAVPACWDRAGTSWSFGEAVSQISGGASTGLALRSVKVEDQGTSCKRRRFGLASETGGMETPSQGPPSLSPSWQRMNPQSLCSTFSHSRGPAWEACPEVPVHSLDFEMSKYVMPAAVSHLLPSWLCLRSLHLHSEWVLREEELMMLVDSLRQLFQNPSCSLTDLSIAPVSCHTPVSALLNACPTLRSLYLEIYPAAPHSKILWSHTAQSTGQSVFSMEKLSVKSSKVQMNLESFLAVLKHSPNLTTLHITGIPSASLLLHTLSASNTLLKVLILEDINLADRHSEIIHLLENSVLEELSIKDCRLLDKCTVKEEFLRPFVNVLKGLSSLRSLELPQNRLAKNVIELADLFSGSSPSKITKLDLSSNFILPADLLEFGRLLDMHRPSQRLTLDLRSNPFDRDQELRGQALKKLLPYCDILTDRWDSRTTMADHISVM